MLVQVLRKKYGGYIHMMIQKQVNTLLSHGKHEYVIDAKDRCAHLYQEKLFGHLIMTLPQHILS